MASERPKWWTYGSSRISRPLRGCVAAVPFLALRMCRVAVLKSICSQPQRRRGPDTPSKLRFKNWLYWGRIMTRRAFNPFTCPNCKALYQVVKVEARLETTDREITCQVCRGPLAGQEAKFVLKYFFLREGIRRKHGGAKAK